MLPRLLLCTALVSATLFPALAQESHPQFRLQLKAPFMFSGEGANPSPQDPVGDGTSTQSSVPVQVLGVDGFGYLDEVTDLDSGIGHTCAIYLSGSVCWGTGGSGRLGDGTATAMTVPVAVSRPL